MGKLVSKVILFFLLLFVMVNLLILVFYDRNDLAATIIDKHELLQNTTSPRIILIGGSCTGFSVNSEMIKEKTGFNPVNMGLFAQFGLRYVLEEVKYNLRKDDVIIVMPEYHHFYYFLDGHRGLLELLFAYPSSLMNLTSFKQYANILKFYPSFLDSKLKVLGERILEFFSSQEHKIQSYKRSGFNQYGDEVAHLSDIGKDVSKRPFFHKFVDQSDINFDKEAIEVLNEFFDYGKSKGASVYFSFPTIPDQHAENNSSFISTVHTQLSEHLKMPMINNPQSRVMFLSLFHDTIYHLNREGRDQSTEKMIADIQRALKGQERLSYLK